MNYISTQTEYKTLKEKHTQAIKQSSDWEFELEKKYTEDEQIDIISMVSYLDNKERGFGRLNDEYHYTDICNSDIDGKLRKEAEIGFNLSKLCNQLRPKNFIHLFYKK